MKEITIAKCEKVLETLKTTTQTSVYTVCNENHLALDSLKKYCAMKGIDYTNIKRNLNYEEAVKEYFTTKNSIKTICEKYHIHPMRLNTLTDKYVEKYPQYQKRDQLRRFNYAMQRANQSMKIAVAPNVVNDTSIGIENKFHKYHHEVYPNTGTGKLKSTIKKVINKFVRKAANE